MTLADKTCEPCRGGVPPFTREQIEPLLSQINGWQVVDDTKIKKLVKTKDFMQSLDKANAIGALAEEQGHHPDLLVRWGELGIEVWTHKVNGLTEADFVLAAKIDRLLQAD